MHKCNGPAPVKVPARPELRYAQVSKETYYIGKRDLMHSQTRPHTHTHTHTHTYIHVYISWRFLEGSRIQDIYIYMFCLYIYIYIYLLSMAYLRCAQVSEETY
jgi:hypothetical protein